MDGTNSIGIKLSYAFHELPSIYDRHKAENLVNWSSSLIWQLRKIDNSRKRSDSPTNPIHLLLKKFSGHSANGIYLHNRPVVFRTRRIFIADERALDSTTEIGI